MASYCPGDGWGLRIPLNTIGGVLPKKKPASRAGRVMGNQILSLQGATGGACSQNSSNL